MGNKKINNQLKISKKSQLAVTQAFFTGLIISLLIILFTIAILDDGREKLVSLTEDIACRGYLQTYHSLTAKTYLAKESIINSESNFFGKFSQYCKSEQLYIDTLEKEEVFEKFSEATRRCYYRYGSGELQFLDFTQREGEYCFICARVDFDVGNIINQENNIDSFKYKELGEYMSKEIPDERNEEKKTYHDLSNFFYVNIQGADDFIKDDFSLNEDQFNELEDFQESYLILHDVYNRYIDLYTREILVNEPSYVVFKYNLDDSYTERLQAAAGIALTSVAIRKGVIFVVKRSVCFLGAAAAGFFTGGIGAVVIGGACIVDTGKAVSSGIKGVKSGLDKYNELKEKMAKFKLPNSLNAKDKEKLEKTAKIIKGLDSDDFKNVDFQTGKGLDAAKVAKLKEIFPDIDFKDLKGAAAASKLKKQLNLDPKTVANLKKLDSESSELYGDVSKLKNAQQLRKLFTLILQAQLLTLSQSPTFDSYKQYTEIIPQSEMFAQCGIVIEEK